MSGFCALAAPPARPSTAADLKTTSKKSIVDRPTLISLGFAWKIEGDANRNAKAEVEYRKKGDIQWRKGTEREPEPAADQPWRLHHRFGQGTAARGR